MMRKLLTVFIIFLVSQSVVVAQECSKTDLVDITTAQQLWGIRDATETGSSSGARGEHDCPYSGVKFKLKYQGSAIEKIILDTVNNSVLSYNFRLNYYYVDDEGNTHYAWFEQSMGHVDVFNSDNEDVGDGWLIYTPDRVEITLTNVDWASVDVGTYITLKFIPVAYGEWKHACGSSQEFGYQRLKIDRNSITRSGDGEMLYTAYNPQVCYDYCYPIFNYVYIMYTGDFTTGFDYVLIQTKSSNKISYTYNYTTYSDFYAEAKDGKKYYFLFYTNELVFKSPQSMPNITFIYSQPLNKIVVNKSDDTYLTTIELPQCAAVTTSTIKVKGKSGKFIQSYKLIIDGFEQVVDDYVADVSAYTGKTVNVTVIPLFDDRLAETHSVSINEGENILQLDNYYYAVQLRAFYKDPLGNLKPISFNWQISGDMKPDKVNSVGQFNMGGTGYENFTVLVPAGDYSISFSANILGFDKSDSQNLTLLDDNYYKYVTFIASLTSSEIQNGSSSSAILQVIVNDQYGKEVNNATVKVYDGNNTLIANQFTHDGQAIVGGFQIGSSYKIEVWVEQTKKAEKSITITEASQTVIITINLDEQEEEYLSGGGDTTFGGGTGGAGEDTHTVAQNIVLSIFKSYGFWGLVILISITVLAAANGGERIGLLTFVAGLGVLTFVIPLLPQVIFVVVAIIAFLFFGWQAVDRIVAGRG